MSCIAAKAVLGQRYTDTKEDSTAPETQCTREGSADRVNCAGVNKTVPENFPVVLAQLLVLFPTHIHPWYQVNQLDL